MTTYDPPLLPGSDGYIAPAAPGERECLALSNDDQDLYLYNPYGCTVATGHKGDHAAHGVEGQLFATWPQEGAS